MPRKFVPVLIVALVVLLGLGGILIYKNKKSQMVQVPNQNLNQTQAASQPSDDDSKKIITEVGKLIKLPTDETPLVRSIIDVEKLKSASYGAVFKNAKDGDMVLIYSQNKQIIVYSTLDKQIIAVAPFNIATASAQPAP